MTDWLMRVGALFPWPAADSGHRVSSLRLLLPKWLPLAAMGTGLYCLALLNALIDRCTLNKE